LKKGEPFRELSIHFISLVFDVPIVFILSTSILVRVIRELFKGKKVKVYLFGSRAKGAHTPRSDLDLGFLSEEDISYDCPF